MSGATGNALEWALALLRAPGERHALRQSPLPAGIERLLAIAAGVETDESVAEIAKSLGESGSRLREATQFYAREVLFHPNADAYRSLGVSSDASTDQIKTHHRLLQLWLHPDRQKNEDDSVFASRVNIAWNRLRNDERRRSYDSQLAEAQEQMPVSRDEIVETRRMAPAWMPAAPLESEPSSWRHRIPVLVLLAVCLLLGWLAVRNGERQPEAWVWSEQDSPEQVDGAAGAGDAPASGEAARVASSAPTPSRREMRKQPADSILSRPARALAALVGGNREAPAPTKSVQAASSDGGKGTSEPLQLAVIEKAALPAAPSIRFVPERQQPARLAMAVESTPVQPPVAPPPPPKVPVAVAETKQAPARVLPASIAMEAAPPPAPPTSTAPADDAPNLARIQQARRVGAQLLQYLAARNRAPPPIWNSPAIMSSADGLRQDMHAQGRARIGVPQWRIGKESAGLTSPYRLDGIEGSAGTGVLSAEMVWRENRWLVVGLSVEHAQ